MLNPNLKKKNLKCKNTSYIYAVIREAAKVLLFMAVLLRPNPPPSSLMAVGKLEKKRYFFPNNPASLPSPS